MAEEQRGLIKDFDHVEFAKNLAGQAEQVVPPGIGDEDKKFIVEVVYKFCHLAGEALNNDPEVTLDNIQASLITQFIGEWTFHKSIDLIRSGIDPNLREEILKKVAFTVFEIAKQAVLKRMPQEQIIPLVEHHVTTTFRDIIADLESKNILDHEMGEQVLSQSNIDEMARVQAEAEVPGGTMSDTKILKLASLAMLIKSFDKDKINKIIAKFDPPEAEVLMQYLSMHDLENKIDSSITKRCFDEMRTLLPEPKVLSANRFYSKIVKLARIKGKESITTIVQNERPVIQDFIRACFEKREVAIPARVASIVCAHIEEKA